MNSTRLRQANLFADALQAIEQLPFDVYVIDYKLPDGSGFAVIAVAVVLGWPSTRRLTVTEIAEQIGCTPATIARACARFREMAGLDSDGGIRPGAGSSNGDKPAARFNR